MNARRSYSKLMNLLFVVMLAAAPAIGQTHIMEADYSDHVGAGTLTVTNSYSIPAGIIGLTFSPNLPVGWTVVTNLFPDVYGVQGIGTGGLVANPVLDLVSFNDMAFIGALSSTFNPIMFQYSVNIPAGASGSQQISGTWTYTPAGGTEADNVTVTNAPNPFIMTDPATTTTVAPTTTTVAPTTTTVAATTTTTTALVITNVELTAGTNYVIGWNAESGVTYRVWWKNDLLLQWATGQTETVTGGQWEDTNSIPTARFYRLSP